MIHVLAPPCVLARRIARCPRCRQRRRMVVRIWAWYSPSAVCCACGAMLSGGRWGPPHRGQRDRALADWPHAVNLADALEKIAEA
jgi:hypothetical protein